MIADFAFLHPALVHLLWLAIAIAAALVVVDLRRRDALDRFISRVMQLRLAVRAPSSRRIARAVAVLATLAFGVLALMRPQTHTATTTLASSNAAADILFVLDVSKSMLAEDAVPNRLGRAKAEIADLVARFHGHRVGLVAFAGRASVVCPLTPDYGFFRMILRNVDTRSVSRGGTRIGDAIRKGVAVFGPTENAKLLVLITDGEDHESYPTEAATEAKKHGVRIISIGFGSETGSPITLTDPTTGAKNTLTDRDGAIVTSRLDGETLRTLALATEGAYVPAGTAALDLDSIVRSHIEPMAKASHGSHVRIVPEEYYPWFVALALASLFAAVWFGALPPRRGLV